MSELKEKFYQVRNNLVINLINKKIEEIENYSIDSQENEEKHSSNQLPIRNKIFIN